MWRSIARLLKREVKGSLVKLKTKQKCLIISKKKCVKSNIKVRVNLRESWSYQGTNYWFQGMISVNVPS